MQILCDKVTGVVFAGVRDMQGAGDRAVAALGTKPAPTLAKSDSEYCQAQARSPKSKVPKSRPKGLGLTQ